MKPAAPLSMLLLTMACGPKTPVNRGQSVPQPPPEADSTDAPMMSAYATSAPDRIVVHVADVTFNAEVTGWSGDESLVPDLHIRTLDDGLGVFSRVELEIEPGLQQYAYGLQGSSDHVWVQLRSGERELVLTLHAIEPETPSAETEPEAPEDPGPSLEFEYWYVTAETLLQTLEEEAGVWVYYESGLEPPPIALSVVGKGLHWRGVAALIGTSLAEHGYALDVVDWTLRLRAADPQPESWSGPPWATDDDERPPPPGEVLPGDETAPEAPPAETGD
jgi:hypothetical protein